MPDEPRDQEALRALGEAVRTLRDKTGLSGEELATRARISSSWLSRIEDGLVDPTWGTARMISEGLDVTAERLAELAEGFEEEA